VDCWKIPSAVDPYSRCEVEAIKAGGMKADPTFVYQCLGKLSNTLDAASGKVNVTAVKALLVNYTELTADEKARAADLAEQCVANPEKVLAVNGWLAVQASSCMTRAFAMVTGMKGCPRREPVIFKP